MRLVWTVTGTSYLDGLKFERISLVEWECLNVYVVSVVVAAPGKPSKRERERRACLLARQVK